MTKLIRDHNDYHGNRKHDVQFPIHIFKHDVFNWETAGKFQGISTKKKVNV